MKPDASLARRAAAALALILAGTVCTAAAGEEPSGWWEGGARLEVTSATFARNGHLPDSMIYDSEQNGLNACTANGAAGADRSPQLAWKNVPPNTRSFAVVLYDPTAAFTHWGMYNIPASVRALPADAGSAGSRFGIQIVNDFGDRSYDGPCPPANVTPDAHHYVFTVYALDVDLKVPSASANFPANTETLYHALIHAARDGHILGSGSLGTYYSSTPK
jgi:Raf kinase inhibitor-like YbhB/YbcL family protein